MRKVQLFLIFLLLIGFSFATTSKINVDVIDDIPYIDYTLYANNSFKISLPDYSSLIYIKTLPEDMNYKIKEGILSSDYNQNSIIILKYKGSPFLENGNYKEKTLYFDLLNETQIVLNSEEEIIKTSPNYIFDENTYIWDINEKNFLLYIVKKKEQTGNIVLFIIGLIVLIGIISTMYFKKGNIKEKENNKIILDNTQKSIIELIKKRKNINQQTISDELNIKKSHLSKILNKMERNDLIERKKVGKVNRIVIK